MVESYRDQYESIKREIELYLEENFESILDVKIDPNTEKKSIALYKQYLLKGNTAYLGEVDMNALPFYLLTKERTVEDSTDAHYSKAYLNSMYDLDLTVNKNSSLITEDFDEIFEMIMDKETTFFENSPLSIKQYIVEGERHSRDLIISNFK